MKTDDIQIKSNSKITNEDNRSNYTNKRAIICKYREKSQLVI